METLKDWLKGMDYEILAGRDDERLEEVVYSSSKVCRGCVFVCIKGARFDSHEVIEEAAAAGCRSFVVERSPEELKLPPDLKLNIIRVENTRRALALLSAARFGHPARRLKVIGVTGTKGKTSFTYMVASVLKAAGHTCGIIGTNGCVYGDRFIPTRNTTPESYELHEHFFHMVQAGCDYAVIECSSQGFKLDRTYGIDFDRGIFLNITNDHIGPDEHSSFEEYLSCKAMLAAQTRDFYINYDDPHRLQVLAAAEEACRRAGTVLPKVHTFSTKDSRADLLAEQIRPCRGDFGIGMAFHTRGTCNGDFRISLPGEFNVSNCLPAIAALTEEGIGAEAVGEGLSHVRVNGRTELVLKTDEYEVIVDYAHNEISMKTLIETLRGYEHGRIVVVFGCGGNRSKDRRTGMGAAAAALADFSVFTSDNSRFEKPEDILADIDAAYLMAGGKPENRVCIPDRAEAIRYALVNHRPGDMIAVIGKGHEDYQEVNGVRTHFLDREEILKAYGKLEGMS